jgi:hypothetical protein
MKRKLVDRKIGNGDQHGETEPGGDQDGRQSHIELISDASLWE